MSKGPRGKCRRCAPEDIHMNPSWGRVSPPPEMAKVFRRIKAVMAGHGQTVPITVRARPDGNGFDVIDPDGQLRLKAAEELGWEQVDVYLLDGEVSDEEASELAMGLLGARADADKALLANALETLLEVYDEDPDEVARLAAVLPFRTKDLGKVVKRLRGQNKAHTVRTASHVDLKFRLPPDAAKVVGEAVDHVVANHDGASRNTAIEYLAADYMSGVVQ